ncbi:hypothetical protein TI39_contig461g00005 [Zymoseptoria brevis]|uniref:PH signal transduction protein PalH n=1 Tax=Zymoseptoria brevis TaxID=1047168 RepID=A0A0F4GK26_9PEZI|nr:hypothetical protein TI39_contig461g00005 [Zymoseptoria brevis]
MFIDEHRLFGRQLWNLPDTSATSADISPECTPFTLPQNGVIQLADSVITLTTHVIFQPVCTGSPQEDSFTIGHLRDPFYASTIPTVYVLASAMVIAWVLVIMLAITSRTSYLGAPQSAPAFSNGHGIIGGASGGTSGLSGAGSRPWLQKVAAIAVAISLTIATADTFVVAENQYSLGLMDAVALRRQVLGSLEIRITRVISDIFLWLAQVQTLIRLFPRHKEKVMIKWIGFVLIIFDTVFSCLNAFYYDNTTLVARRTFVEAIPALSYLFELALGLLYAAWVVYYSITKRRYAFYHPKMWNICVIALLSVVAILTPVVFFITDVIDQDVAGWGDYFRWVGAAAASVVVWEWVERIEALERDDKKDGILGREIFDGDEMLDSSPGGGEEAAWSQSRNLRRNFRRHRKDDDVGGGNATSKAEKGGFSQMTQRFRSRHQQSPSHFPLGRAHTGNVPLSQKYGIRRTETRASHQPETTITSGPTPPMPVMSPVDRGQNTSGASTIYTVRYENGADVPEPVIRWRSSTNRNTPKRTIQKTAHRDAEKEALDDDVDEAPSRNREQSRWKGVPNPFKRKRTSPPQEVQRARQAANDSQLPSHNFSKWDVRNRLGVLAAETGERIRDRAAPRSTEPQETLPVTIIPAQPRGGRTWTPAAAEEEESLVKQQSGNSDSPPRSADTTVTTSSTLTADPYHAREPQSQARTTHNGREPTPPVLQLRRTEIPRSDNISPTTARSGPPRADDISPAAGRKGATVVVPAPPRRTPDQRATPAAEDRSAAGSAPPGNTPERSTSNE